MLKRLLFRVEADLLFLVHLALFLFILFGWLWTELWIPYVALLLATLASTYMLGYCPFSKWEFDLRKKLHPELNYEYHFSSYYTNKLTHHRLGLTNQFIDKLGKVYIVCATAIVVGSRLIA